MVCLDVLSGSKAGLKASCARLPIRVGRAPENDLALEDGGVFPGHFTIHRQENDLILQAGTDAMVTVNGEAVKERALRNGDLIGVGAVKVHFGFTPVRQASLAWREGFTWAALAVLVFGEVVIAYSMW